MEKNIDELIVNLQSALLKKYGENFKRFYLIKNPNESQDWEGLIHYNDEGERQVKYYTIKNQEVIKDDKIFH